ncbi:uncharacterized protein N7515_006808 [Penicillium bovifimosum]|uniref:Major facilitator superfamily (MFS) profile domain-containing protein n=1 Tax=Penicillium bovifimosum TaxID=126998 RepID=A0A9W9GVD2_9EURO|nr:uncharacterized protein N7515_006808 [Penicillium bovifimosum]KAJ5130769.1 hypothetical protein N7515_006808 [Penicillium bovifimosum]
MTSQHSSLERQEERPEHTGCVSRDTDSVVSISTVDSVADHNALGTTLTARVSSLAERVTTVATNATADPDYEVDWDGEDDPENPMNWKFNYKVMCLVFLSWNTLTVVLYSTSYTSGTALIAEEFGQSKPIVTLGLTFYLFGLAIGSMLMAPLSEVYGRKPVCVICLALFTILIIPCALAKSVTELIVIRFIGAFFGSVMISTAPGMVADLVDDEHRALAISIWSLGPLNGPVIGPVIGGFITQYLGWRWMCWIVLMLSAIALAFAISIKETYAPTLLRNKAAKLRKESGDSRWWCRYDEKASLYEILKLNLSRPFVMAVSEPICIFWNIYIAIIYGILYLCFVAYPIVFQGIRGWDLGLSGLAFLGIGLGVLVTISCEPFIRRLIDSHPKDPETGKVYPEAMVSFVCICAAIIPIGELWFAWTCSPVSIHWIAPILAGIPFGAGNTGVFIYSSNYLTGSYGMYAASALAGNSVIRSVLGGVLPLAGSYMYDSLGPNWSGTLLGLLEVAIVPIPIVFYKYGHKIRMKSPLITRMQEEKMKLEGKRARRQPLPQQADQSSEEKVDEAV